MLTRRDFLKLSAAGLSAVVYASVKGKFITQVRAAVPTATLVPTAIPKYQTPLLIPPVMPRAGVIEPKGGKETDYYEISMQQFSQQILPAGYPATTVWGYGAVKSASKKGLLLHNAPSLTIEATWNRPVRIKWINNLKDANGNYLPHLLPVDQTLHWANPGGGTTGRDTRPSFQSTPGTYTGPVPNVPHLHGAVGVGDESDGYAEAWFLPGAANIPVGYASQGTWYDFFKAKAASKLRTTWGSGYATFQYPNLNRASTIWYHDHTLGMTRVNVYAGPAGFFLIRGGPSGDKTVRDTRTKSQAVFPGPAPKEGDAFPATRPYYEIPIAIQDRAFNADGSLFYPDTREFFDQYIGPYIPDTDVSPIWNPEFFGNTIMVNGNTWPFQTVEKRRYRLRFLNGCQARFLILNFGNIPGVEVWQIGNEGGFLATPCNLTANNANQLLMSPAERADVIVDFTNVPVGNYVLANLGPDEPYGGGLPGSDFEPADPGATGQIMEFRVVPAISPDKSTPPRFLQLPALQALPASNVTRPLALMEEMSMTQVGPAAAMLGTLDEVGMPLHHMWMDPVTENPNVGDTETWEFYNFTVDAHPIHVHEVAFEVLNREGLVMDAATGEPVTPVQLTGSIRPPEAWESGVKDTVIAYPGEVTRIRAQFKNPGQFAWHCHIVEHEDNEMMRPFRIGPLQAGQPG